MCYHYLQSLYCTAGQHDFLLLYNNSLLLFMKFFHNPCSNVPPDFGSQHSALSLCEIHIFNSIWLQSCGGLFFVPGLFHLTEWPTIHVNMDDKLYASFREIVSHTYTYVFIYIHLYKYIKFSLFISWYALKIVLFCASCGYYFIQ